MAATAVGCLWLLFRQGGPAAFVAGLATAVALAILLLWTGWAQRKGRAIGWPALAAALVLTAIAATQVPRQPQAAARVPLGAEAWSEAAVAKYRAAGKPVFVYFTADWCLTCKANEAAAIEREATRDAFGKAGVKVLVGDWTNGDPAITRFLESRGRAGVPLYLWYAPGQAEPEELPQILTPGMLTERADQGG
jgi:thiol:disulfide interchange protein